MLKTPIGNEHSGGAIGTNMRKRKARPSGAASSGRKRGFLRYASVKLKWWAGLGFPGSLQSWKWESVMISPYNAQKLHPIRCDWPASIARFVAILFATYATRNHTTLCLENSGAVKKRPG